MPEIDTLIPDDLFDQLSRHLMKNPAQSLEEVVCSALKTYLETRAGSLFQVSTAGALVAGIYDSAVSVDALIEYGNLGLGTFENLDGEMIIAGGQVFQARSDGSVRMARGDQMTPFAVITSFKPSVRQTNVDCASLDDLEREFDHLRVSKNLWYALCVTGSFERLRLRVVRKTEAGVGIVKAADRQAEFTLENLEGTVVGFWSPAWAAALSVPGYHLHFISKEKDKAGHVLELSGKNLCLELEPKTSIATLLPQNEHFLQAELACDPTADLAIAEKAQSRGAGR
jgi:acetolactate decarboxylase